MSENKSKLYTVREGADGWYAYFLGGGKMGPYATEADAYTAADRYIIRRLTVIYERKDQ